MIYVYLIFAAYLNAVMDNIQQHDSFRELGKWFSRDGWTNKYTLTEWLNKYLPLGLSKFLAQDVLVVFTDCFHLSKALMILLFCYMVEPSAFCLVYWLCFSVAFNLFYYLTK